jgi:hypothetical protein
MPRGKKFTAEQIMGKLCEAEVDLARGKTVPEVVRKLDVTDGVSAQRGRDQRRERPADLSRRQ